VKNSKGFEHKVQSFGSDLEIRCLASSRRGDTRGRTYADDANVSPKKLRRLDEEREPEDGLGEDERSKVTASEENKLSLRAESREPRVARVDLLDLRHHLDPVLRELILAHVRQPRGAVNYTCHRDAPSAPSRYRRLCQHSLVPPFDLRVIECELGKCGEGVRRSKGQLERR
jgi:hypothetical protein